MPIDPSIFLQGAALKQRQDEQLLKTIQSGVKNVQDQRTLRAQLDIAAKKAENAGFDFDKLAQKAAIRLASGQGTEEDKLVLGTWDKFNQTKLMYDPTTGAAGRANASLMGPGGFDLGAMAPKMASPSGAAPPTSSPASRPQGGFNVGAVAPQMPKSRPIAPEFAANPAAKQKYLESAAAEKGKYQAEKETGFNKALTGLENYIAKQAELDKTIDSAIKKTGPLSAGWASETKGVGGTPAANLEAILNTIAADSAFAELQNMRDNSKTGGALGSVSENELALLRDAQASLAQSQGPKQLRENLERYKKIRREGLERVKNAYQRDYGTPPAGIGKTAPVGTNAIDDELRRRGLMQ